jgi:hypothetical protein
VKQARKHHVQRFRRRTAIVVQRINHARVVPVPFVTEQLCTLLVDQRLMGGERSKKVKKGQKRSKRFLKKKSKG